jgi:hypothetical protein
MLANRLCGTIDKSVSNRTGRFELLPIQLRCATPKTTAHSSTIFWSHREPTTGSRLLTRIQT